MQELSEEEQAVIDRDFGRQDYRMYREQEQEPLLLPEDYAAGKTFELIRKRIWRPEGWRRKAVLKYASAAAVLLLFVLSVYVYRDFHPSLLYVSSSYGEQKECVLPDGSYVLLNNLSFIAYPEKWQGNERKVKLCGEAFFRVSKDEKKPFIVETGSLDVQVKGTVFNVQAYKEEDRVITSLLEGAVGIVPDEGRSVDLRPGDRAIYTKSTQELSVEHLPDIELETSWKLGRLYFDQTPLGELLRTVGREKAVFFLIEDAALERLCVSALFEKAAAADSILNVLSQSAGFTYMKTGNTYIIQ